MHAKCRSSDAPVAPTCFTFSPGQFLVPVLLGTWGHSFILYIQLHLSLEPSCCFTHAMYIQCEAQHTHPSGPVQACAMVNVHNSEAAQPLVYYHPNLVFLKASRVFFTIAQRYYHTVKYAIAKTVMDKVLCWDVCTSWYEWIIFLSTLIAPNLLHCFCGRRERRRRTWDWLWIIFVVLWQFRVGIFSCTTNYGIYKEYIVYIIRMILPSAFAYPRKGVYVKCQAFLHHTIGGSAFALSGHCIVNLLKSWSVAHRLAHKKNALAPEGIQSPWAYLRLTTYLLSVDNLLWHFRSW